MPRKYKRKEGVRARVCSWTTEQLQSAFDEMDRNTMGINEISRQFGIPPRTLRRRYTAKNTTKQTLGKHPILDFANEKRLVKHILKLGDAGFPPNRQSIRMLAYQFAEKLELKHNFDHENEMAGAAWFKSFIERNPELSIRQAEGLSVARAKGLSREKVNNFYDLLIKVLTENDLLDKPERLYNMDESGIQLNNKPGKVIAKKGAKVVNSVTSAEKGETMTIVGCCNAIGNFLPPVLIIKGVNKKPEFQDGLPMGSKVYMNKKSAYINASLFDKWLTEHFIPLKAHGKVLLILDGHSSHSSAPNMLQAAADNDIILLCLPSHTTSALQPLDRSVFGPFKTYFNQETNQFMRLNPNKKISRYNAGKLIRNAWIRAATPANALAGFRGSGIYPVCRNALPDTTFLISDTAMDSENPGTSRTPHQVDRTSTTQAQTSYSLDCQPELVNVSESIVSMTIDNQKENISEYEQIKTPPNLMQIEIDRESPSLLIDSEILDDINIFDIDDSTIAEILGSNIQSETPSKILIEASPIPKIPLTMSKRAKQSANILNSKENIEQKKRYG
ncbi:unnamed protein product [Arctia plantaginis]|uniref:HTH CENPB-type domain-containing protein n=1 Tax=Arctia plantaginis TaxID=874455 RepID=A0A8S0ZSP1_ARCPL|nr:unnamed protein product [Arctia plantaginis]